MNGKGTPLRWAFYLGAIAVALVLPQVIYPILALDILLWGLFAVSLDLLLGFAGLLSFGHAMFWGTAGYAAGYFAKNLGLAFPLAVLVGTVAAALLAVPIGYLSIRRKGIYFSMVTLAFAQMVFYVINEWREVTGGENGLQGIPRVSPIPGVSLSEPAAFYYAALPFLLFGFWLAYRIVHSPFGHVLVALRDNEARAQALGYPTQRYKLLGFVLSATLAGLAGSIQAIGHGFIALESVHWSASGNVVVMTILGGIGTLWGPIVGAAFVLLLRDWLSTSPLAEGPGVVTGIIFVLVVLSFRRGIWGTAQRWLQSRQPATPPRPAPADAPQPEGAAPASARPEAD